MKRNRRAAGTTLVEVLVVIVVFAIGILAVVQIFPKGFQVLKTARDTSVATQLGRDEIERLKARPDQLPEEILPVRMLGSTVVVDNGRAGGDLGPAGDRLTSDGTLYWGNASVGQWQLNSGANLFRRIIGEGRQVPASVGVGQQFGGLMILQFGPVFDQALDSANGVNSPVLAYGTDLVRRVTPLPGPKDDRQDNEYWVDDPDSSSVALYLPTGPTDRRYRVVLSAYVQNGAGTAKRDFVGLGPVVVPASAPDAGTGLYPLYSVSLADLLSARAGVTLYGVEPDSIRVSRVFTPVAVAGNFSNNDPYEYKVLIPSLGVLMFNPLASNVTVAGPSGTRAPLLAKVDYDVADWRVLREEFRIPDGSNPQHRLALGNLRTAGSAGADGLSSQGFGFESTISSISDPKASHFVAMDLATGGVFAEISGGVPLITVDKSLGLVTFRDVDSSTDGVQGLLLLPGATNPVKVNMAGRAVRVLYAANGEWSVQVMKAASNYTLSTGLPGAAQYYVGGSNSSVGGVSTRIYFPASDVGRKVTIDELRYIGANGQAELLGQDFVVQYNRPDTLPLPSIDLRSAVPDATSFTLASGYAVQGVKGASVAVRVLHNPERFSLGQDPVKNMSLLEQWGRNWKRSTTETYLQRGEVVR